MKLAKITIQLSKDILKDLAHRMPLIPYQKPSKRYKIWNRAREKRFMSRIVMRYSHNPTLIDSITATVIMPTYNRSHCIEQAIESVRKQTHKKWELIIVNDGSTDNIADIEQKLKNNKTIRFIHTDHKGVSHARNVGIENAKGKYIFYLDTDNQWRENYLRTMITCLETENIGACYSAVQLIDDKGETIGYYGEKFDYNECRKLNYIDINGLGHVNSEDTKHLRFDESLRRLVDWDFILTLAQMVTIRYAPFVGVKYYDGQKGNRITLTESTGSEINEIINKIRAKHSKKE